MKFVNLGKGGCVLGVVGGDIKTWGTEDSTLGFWRGRVGTNQPQHQKTKGK